MGLRIAFSAWRGQSAGELMRLEVNALDPVSGAQESSSCTFEPVLGTNSPVRNALAFWRRAQDPICIAAKILPNQGVIWRACVALL